MAGSDITLRDGRSVHVRGLRVADEAEFLQAFERLSSHARYMRFMRVVREPDPERLHAVLASFPEAGIGIVATVPAADGIDIVGERDRRLRQRPGELRVRDHGGLRVRRSRTRDRY